jgi:hypothetical protein
VEAGLGATVVSASVAAPSIEVGYRSIRNPEENKKIMFKICCKTIVTNI